LSPPRRSTHRSPARFLGRVVEGAVAGPFPGFVQPCRPTERKVPPAGEGWLHEIMHDGYRLQAQVREGVPRLYTGDGHDWTARMPAMAASVEALPVNNAVLDGELAAVDAKGQPAFFELPPALGAPTRVKGRLVYYTFDMLYLDGFDLRGVALIDRKRVLETLLFNTSGVQLVKYVEHIVGDGAIVLEHACRLGLKGIVSKLAEAPYRSGRSRNWIKTKCTAWRYTNRTRFEKMRGR